MTTQPTLKNTVQTTTTENEGFYERLCQMIDMQPVTKTIRLSDYSDSTNFADISADERVTAALQVLLKFVTAQTNTVKRIDRVLLDGFIARIDEMLSDQLNTVMHNPAFQQVESRWSSLRYLVERTDFKSNIKLEILDVSKQALLDDFSDAPDATQSGLYKHVYVDEYDTPGGEPISAIISDIEFDSGAQDIALLRDVSKVAAVAHCPFLGSIGAKFFGKNDIDDIMKIEDIGSYMERAEFIRWNGFRESEDARYVGLCFPRFLLRLPYGEQNPVKGFNYQEKVRSESHENFLWGAASFAFAANLTNSFKKNGWTVNIRGPRSGGKVENLPIHQYDAGRGLQTKIPSESVISETRELEFANLGFIPLSYYKNSDYACFFSANSTQKPKLYTTSQATANSRINSRLPYIFLASRIGHYLKVLQRENIGAAKDKTVLEKELNGWLQTLVTTMNDPHPDLIATHPLREGSVQVNDIEDNPGYYSVSLFIRPHFQVEGVDVRLSLVSQMPAAAK